MDFEEALDTLQYLLELKRFFDSSVSTGVSIVFAFVAIINLVQCFFGYKLFKLLSTIVGSFVGAIVGIIICASLHLNSATIPVILFCAIGGAVLAFSVYKLGVFVYTGFLPGLIAALLSQEPVIFFIVFAFFGVLGVILSRPYLIASTSIPSGIAAGMSIMIIFKMNNTAAGVFIGLVLAIIGFIYQWKTTKDIVHEPKKKQVDPEKSAVENNPDKPSQPDHDYSIKYINIKLAYCSLALLIVHAILSILHVSSIITSLCFLASFVCFFGGAFKDIPKGPDGKPLKCEDIISPSDAANVFVFKKPRIKPLVIGVVLFLVYLFVYSKRDYLYYYDIPRFIIDLLLQLKSVGLFLACYSFMYRFVPAECNTTTDPTKTTNDTVPVELVDAGMIQEDTNSTDEYNSSSTAPDVSISQPDQPSAPASSFDLDKLKTSAKSLIDTVPYIFKDAKIPDSLKDFKLKDYQFSFNSPSIPLLIGGLAIILIGTIFNFKVLNILGLIVIAVSFIHKTSQQE